MIDYKEYLFQQTGFKLLNESERITKINDVNDKIENGSIHFSNVKFMQTNNRSTAFFDNFTVEKTICNYLTDVLNTKYSIKYPNRNLIMENLFDNMKVLKNLDDFTIYRFDFKKYFSSISTDYAIEYLKIDSRLNKYQLDYLELFSKTFAYLPVGISISNAISELFGIRFDEKLIDLFGRDNIIFYSRFIDDGFLIMKNYWAISEVDKIMQRVIDSIFYRKDIESLNLNRVKLNRNGQKEVIIHRRNLTSSTINYLGYRFDINSSPNNPQSFVKYGITEEKMMKIKKKYINIYSQNSRDNQSLKILTYNHSRRVVYNKGDKNSSLWINKGITFNYGLLPYFISKGSINKTLIIEETDSFLSDFFSDINKQLGLNMANFLESSKYCLRHSIASNSAIIYHQTIGVPYTELKLRANAFKITTTNKSYNEILSDYLIALHLGY